MEFPEISVEEGCNFVNRTIIATTLFLGISLAAPADGAAYTKQDDTLPRHISRRAGR
jgi:hypothetical protein